VANASRTRKYTFLLIAIVSFWTLRLWISGPWGWLSPLPSNEGQPGNLWQYILLTFAAGPAILLLLGFMALRIARPWEGAQGLPAPRTVRTLYGMLIGLGVPFVFVCFFLSPTLFIWPLVAAYLILRYMFGERLGWEPILYLRSFSHAAGSRAFGRIIIKTAVRFGVVVGLVHQKQRPSDLHRLARATEHGLFHTVPDDEWQGWVAAHLRRCSAVIIDVSLETSSVTWELEHALRVVGAERMLVLKQKGSHTPVPPQVRVVEYQSEASGEEGTKAALMQWLINLFYKPASAGTVATGWQAYLANIVVVWVCILTIVGAGLLGYFLDRKSKPDGKASMPSWMRPPTPVFPSVPKVEMPQPPAVEMQRPFDFRWDELKWPFTPLQPPSSWILPPTARSQDWVAVTAELLKSEKTGFGGLCGVVIHPPSGDVIINLSDRGLFRSRDQGTSWQRLGSAPLKGRTETPGCLMIDPFQHQRLVSTLVYGSPIVVSPDLGESWRTLSPRSSHVDWCAVDWSDPDLRFILALKHESGDLLLVSRDGGRQFEEIGKGYGPAWIFDGKTAVVAEAKTKTNAKPGLLRTTDSGKTFQPCGNYYARALPRFQSGTLYWLVEGVLIASSDQGQTWKKLSEVKEGRCGPVFGRDAQHLFVLTVNSIRESKDGGVTWQAPIPLPVAMKGAGNLAWLEYDARQDILYVMKMGSELYRWTRRKN
jgi:photosystem II stability/assembly factor-like uncharacterized protein